MKPTHVALFSALGMMFTSLSVYSLAPSGGGSSVTAVPEVITEPPRQVPEVTGGAVAAVDPSRFTTGSRLMLEGRVGHARLPRSAQETFLMFEVRGDGSPARSQAQANLSLVIDRSGSMKGTRLTNAVQAATTAVSRLNDGDVVSVVTFDTRTSVVVPPTTVGPETRGRILASVRGISLGGDTCISCGIEEGLSLLGQTSAGVSRMLVLSDGDANHGVRDVPGFRAMAQRARDRGVAITTIGVDVDYNEKILSAIALDSNGRHYFVENDAALARIFEAEAEQLTTSVASGAELAIDLAPGVELDRVFDRSFRRAGGQVIVPLGAFAAGEVKTVLLKVRLGGLGGPGGDARGDSPIADVGLTYRDLVARTDARCVGKLGVAIAESDADASELDALVAGRAQRSETAAALKQANFLFEQGRLDEARSKLDAQQQSLKKAADKAKRSAPANRAKDVASDFEGQLAALERAGTDFATPPAFATPPPAAGAEPGGFAQAPAAAAPRPAPAQSRQGKSAVRRNEAEAFDLAR
ncbi:vWA domain-containing protein [Sorangium sp. So ce363]|uniref:vWA domain-containing protein n=1 Tax=Sorangium sp. So ce363 TaxID=3133304 RepID=UPI003F5FE18A